MYSAKAAERFITFFQKTPPKEKYKFMLAAAHYTLSKTHTSLNRAKMHANSAMAILRGMTVHSSDSEKWHSLMGHVYFARGELYEDEGDYYAAAVDYLQAMDIIKSEKLKVLSNEDNFLLAKTSIALADLLIQQRIEAEDLSLAHPLSLINITLEHLSKIDQPDNDVIAAQAYSHRLAGITLSLFDFKEAASAFNVSLMLSYRVESKDRFVMLSDVLNCIGFLHEQLFRVCPLQIRSTVLLEEASLYFDLSNLFKPVDSLSEEPELYELERLFEIIYRFLDPFIWSASKRMLYDTINALIFIEHSIQNKKLPNRALLEQLSDPLLKDSFKQHIVWLMVEAFYREKNADRLFEIADPSLVDLNIDMTNLIYLLEHNGEDNIHYL